MKKDIILDIYPTRLTLVILLSIFIMTGKAHADPNVLLGEAIKNAAKLKGSLPTKERLTAYENIFGSLDKIVSEHSSSDQAIKILSGQKIGNFDPSTLRTAYIKDLTGYYDTVCEASPSYSCQAFVSLKTGNEQCAKASNFEEIVEAHLNLKNAAKVFIGQKENKSYISLAMDSYRGCLKRSKFGATTFVSDFFTSELLPLLLKSNQMSLAKASIQNMETPYFKFRGVLELSDHKDKPFDIAFWKRMQQYIKKKIQDKNGNAAMANIILTLDAIRRSSLPIGFLPNNMPSGSPEKWAEQGPSGYMAVQAFMGWGEKIKGAEKVFDGAGKEKMRFKSIVKCDYFYARTVFDLLTTLQTELIGLGQDRKAFNSAQAPGLMIAIADRPRDALEACEKDGYYDYYLMTLMHGQLLLDDPQVAAEFKRRAVKEFFSRQQQLEFFFNHFGTSPEKLALLGPHDRMKVPFPLIQGTGILRRKDARYFVYTKRINFGDVCEASRILYKELKGGDDFDRAIKYMINSPKVDPNTKYNCGDEDLELLLQ